MISLLKETLNLPVGNCDINAIGEIRCVYTSVKRQFKTKSPNSIIRYATNQNFRLVRWYYFGVTKYAIE